MLKSLTLAASLVLLSTVLLFAQSEPEAVSSGKAIDWFEVLIVIGYLGGVFVILPIVVYTNLKEKLIDIGDDNQDKAQLIPSLSEEDRNNRAQQILDGIEQKLTPYKTEEGDEMITITNGKQARFMKKGLDYISVKLLPTNPEIIDRINEFKNVYNDRTQRAFTGSTWVMLSSAGVGVLFFLTGGISTFLFIHFFGLLFYYLASRTTFYALEKRMDSLNGRGVIGSVMSAIFIGNGYKYYRKHSDGSRSRDWETEGQMAIIGFFFMAVAALFLGIFTALLGIINALLNYWSSYIIPFVSDENWYENNFDSLIVNKKPNIAKDELELEKA
jgi:hypothetical protein